MILNGSAEQLTNFDNFLGQLVEMGMINSVHELAASQICHHPPRNFEILQSTSSHARRGPHSEERFDGESHYSADNNRY